MRKISIPTEEQRKINTLEKENADLAYANMVLEFKVLNTEQNLADLEFQLMINGAV